MENLKKNVLILTADAGFGHRSAANAIAAALKDRYNDECLVEILNPLEDRRTPFFLRDSQTDYDKLVRNSPELYRFGYDASDTSVTSAIVESALTVLLYEVMRDIIRHFQPDVIVSTYPLYQSPIEAVFTMQNREIPLITVVTDLATVHRLWFNRTADACLVPTEIVRDLALNYGLVDEQIFVTGIPVNPQLAMDRRCPAELRAELGWRTDLPTVLAVGSKRVDRLLDTLNVLNHFGLPIQLAVVAGNDQNLYAELELMDWHQPVHLYEYASDVPLMMRAADCLVCKAGGLIITEALAAGCPMMLVDVLPGQETGNAEYVVGNAAGDLARSDVEVLEVFSHWMRDDRRLLKERARTAASLGRPQAAFDVADMVYQCSLRSPGKHRHIFSQRSLIDLLNRNHVRWGDTKDLRETKLP
jgi:1,2-diacylglycerol 3-beta-galactosyltransferase